MIHDLEKFSELVDDKPVDPNLAGGAALAGVPMRERTWRNPSTGDTIKVASPVGGKTVLVAIPTAYEEYGAARLAVEPFLRGSRMTMLLIDPPTLAARIFEALRGAKDDYHAQIIIADLLASLGQD